MEHAFQYLRVFVSLRLLRIFIRVSVSEKERAPYLRNTRIAFNASPRMERTAERIF